MEKTSGSFNAEYVRLLSDPDYALKIIQKAAEESGEKVSVSRLQRMISEGQGIGTSSVLIAPEPPGQR